MSTDRPKTLEIHTVNFTCDGQDSNK